MREPTPHPQVEFDPEPRHRVIIHPDGTKELIANHGSKRRAMCEAGDRSPAAWRRSLKLGGR